MRTVLRASLRAYTRRYVAAGVAVVIAVAFLVVTDALVAATRNGITAGVGLPYRTADAVVSDLSGEQAVTLVARARQRGDRAAVLGWVRLPVNREAGLIATDAPVGARRRRPGAALADPRGGTLPRPPAVRGWPRARRPGPTRCGSATGSGSVRATRPSTSRSSGWSTARPPRSPRRSTCPGTTWHRSPARFYVDSVAYDGAGPEAAVLADLKAATPGTVRDRDTFVTDRTIALSQGVDVQRLILLLFAAIALFVSVLVIANTYSILFAQRTREFALLRCIGATGRQLLRSVRVEALVLGAVAAAAGVLVGIAAGRGLVALAGRLEPSAPLGAATSSPLWLAGAYVIGVLVSLVAAWVPTRRVAALSPQAALQPDRGIDVGTPAGRWRIAAGLGLVVAGTGLLGLAILSHLVPVMIAGGAAVFTGLLLLGPVLMPALVRFGGLALRPVLGMAGRLAAANAVRNPRRTAATTASLLVGVTLTTAVLTGLASSRVAVDAEMDRSHPLDATLTATGGAAAGGPGGRRPRHRGRRPGRGRRGGRRPRCPTTSARCPCWPRRPLLRTSADRRWPWRPASCACRRPAGRRG